MAPLRPSSHYNDPPLRELKPELLLSRAAKLNLEDNIRQRKAHSKRDMAKFAKESEYAQDPSLKEVLWHSKCRRCLQNHWRCFISSDPKSPRKVCKPCGKNKCSFGYSTHRPKTYEDDGADAPPSPGTHAHAEHAGLNLRFPYAGQWTGAATGGFVVGTGGVGGVGGVGGGNNGGMGGVNGGTGMRGMPGVSGMSMGGPGVGGMVGDMSGRSSAESTSSTSSRPISIRDLTPRHLPLPISLKDAFHAFQPPPRPQPRLDTEPLNHSLTARPVSAPSSHSSATSHSSLATPAYTPTHTPAHASLSSAAHAAGHSGHSGPTGHPQGQPGQPGQYLVSQGQYYPPHYYYGYGYYDYSHPYYSYPHARERPASPATTPKPEPTA